MQVVRELTQEIIATVESLKLNKHGKKHHGKSQESPFYKLFLKYYP